MLCGRAPLRRCREPRPALRRRPSELPGSKGTGVQDLETRVRLSPRAVCQFTLLLGQEADLESAFLHFLEALHFFLSVSPDLIGKQWDLMVF